MKKILFCLIVLLGMLAGTSCKKDKPLTLEQKILGKWTWVSKESFHTPADLADYTYILPVGAYWEFKADGGLTIYNGNINSSDPWYKVNDNSFYLNSSGDPNNPYEIITATANQLVFQWEVSDNGIPKITRFTFSKP